MLSHLSKISIKLFTFKSIKNRLAFWFFILGLAPLLLGIITTYRLQILSMEKQTFAKLVAIRDLKVERLNSWLEERISDVKTTATDNELNDLEQVIFKKEKNQSDLKIYKNTRRILNRYINNHYAYEEIFIINPRTGIVEISTNQNAQGMDRSHDAYFTQPMETRKLFIKDIFYSKFSSKMIMTFSMPIFCSTHQGQHILAILVVRMDLEHSLYPLLQERIGLGKTGETLIVNRNVKALNALRWYENAPLNLQIKAQPAINAAQGKTGIIESMDYRGENVLAAYTHIPKTGWGFICKQDVRELTAPIRQLLVYNMAICLLSAMIILVFVLWISRAISKPIVDMGIAARKINHGDYSVRNEIHSQDELGSLAHFINEMTDTIESKITVQKNVLYITEVMTGLSSMKIFASELIKALMETTQSNMGVFYTLNKERSQFEHLISMGANEHILESFDAQNPAGELDYAISNGQISHIKDIPGDTIFKFNTMAGDAIPREILAIPILTGQKVTAIISLVNLNPYTKENIEVLNQSWDLINASHAHLSAGIKTTTLAMNLSNSNKTLEAQALELQEQSEELQQTAQELQEQNLELGAQRVQVEEANRLKSEFLSNMSHELRTPLNSVMALSRVLVMQAREKLSDEEINYLEIIERNGKNLLTLINDILDLSKIEAGRMEISPKPFQISSTIDTIMERLAPLAQEKGVELDITMPDRLPQVTSDENRVHQILQNLISNAVKFTKQGKVSISMEHDAQKIHITVSDTGIGISKKNLPHIFDEFRQVDGTSSRSYEGTGLGLAIAFKAAKMLGGNIDVQSTLGQGSTFTLTLPLLYRESTPIPLPDPVVLQPRAEIQPTRKTILVVDDEPDSLTMISNYLSGEGYNIITATSGQEALRLAQSHRPFAITLDVIMPEMDGFEVLQHLKQTTETREIPVIMVSMSDDRATGMALGAVGYVSKPVNRGLLIAEINNLCGSLAHSILIADDNEFELKEIARNIEQEGMKAIPAANGRICMEKLQEIRPDALVLDLIMPEMNGFEVLEEIRSNPDTRNLPVIVVTAKDLSMEEKQLLSGKASSILEKSETTSIALLDEIKNILSTIESPGKKLKIVDNRDRILMVEDNEASILQVKMLLEGQGYIVDVARGGQEALDYMSQTIPDGIILDLMMPEIDGFQVLEKMRSTQATAKTPVLILTARDLTPEDLSHLSANNVQQLVQKGDIDQQGLLAQIQTMLGKSSPMERQGSETPTLRTSPPEPPRGAPKTPPREYEQRHHGNETENKNEPEPHKGYDAHRRPTLLVVEDNPDNMITLKAILKNQYTLLEAIDGEKGLEMALTTQPDLILLDMSLPKMDGFSVVKRVKKDKKAAHIPVIALTAHAMKGDREKMIQAGCDDYLSKPIDPEKIVLLINKWLEK